ncbi:hypothetical protein B296_00004672 [Ensete ventricosum]|uniref:Uncharacterized protein n=1 Tax=Ensete ventricosum TaxID=4639 RepID=A0A426Z0V9_ENSVE|nr:hypothetical protein B296_00004672 [Ensete ventricosum]
MRQKATSSDLSLQSVYIAAHNNRSLPTILITASNKLNSTAAISHSISLLPSSAIAVYIAAPSSSYCSRTLAATDATCSHEVASQPQPTEEIKARQPYTLKATISFVRHQEKRLKYEARKTRLAPRPALPKLLPPPTVSRPP